jgi:hypothetical protein
VTPCIVESTFLGLPHPMLDLAKGLLDRIEVGRIGRQVPQPRAGLSDQLSDGGGFVAAQIVHDDNVARFQDGHELLLDVSSKAHTIDRPIEDAWPDQLIVAQSANEGQRAPVPMRSEALQALAFRPPASQRRHIGFDPGFIDEDQAPRIEAGLPRSPTLALTGNVGTRLLKGKQCFF